eukprot:3718024-Rhodomonas_salina.1
MRSTTELLRAHPGRASRFAFLLRLFSPNPNPFLFLPSACLSLCRSVALLCSQALTGEGVRVGGCLGSRRRLSDGARGPHPASLPPPPPAPSARPPPHRLHPRNPTGRSAGSLACALAQTHSWTERTECRCAGDSGVVITTTLSDEGGQGSEESEEGDQEQGEESEEGESEEESGRGVWIEVRVSVGEARPRGAPAGFI